MGIVFMVIMVLELSIYNVDAVKTITNIKR